MEEFAIESVRGPDLAADYNVAPTKQVYIVVERTERGDRPERTERGDRPERVEGDDSEAGAQRTLTVAKWGLVPFWAKDPSIGSRLINARVETADSKPAFRRAFAQRRCLVPADGFYEWYTSSEPGAPRTAAGKPLKQPFFIHPAAGGSLALAGLFEFWRDPDPDAPEPWLTTVTILTTSATDALGRIHDRMPLPLPPAAWPSWLDPGSSPEAAREALSAHTAGLLTAYPVSTAVNNVRHNGPELLDPLPEEA